MKLTEEQRLDITNKFGLHLATFPKETKRKSVTAKEFATFKALTKTKTFGLSSLMSDTENENNLNVATKIRMAQTGNASKHTLISLWSRNQPSAVTKTADKRDFGVRMHIDVLERLTQSKAFASVIQSRNVEVIPENNGIEIRFTFETLADALKFIADCAEATQQTEEQTAEEQKSTAQQTEEQKSTKSKSTANKSKSTKSKSKKA